MRISTNHQFDSFSRGITDTQRKLVESQMRATTGKRINRASDDPTGAGSLVRMGAVKQSIGQYVQNGKMAKGVLAATEGALSDVNDLAKEAYQLAVRGASDTVNAASRAAMAAEVVGMQKRLVDLGNTQDANGGYLFAGQRNDKPPFTAQGSNLVYNGDGRTRFAELAADQTVPINTSGTPLMTDLYTRLESLRQALTDGNTEKLSQTSIPEMQKSVDALNLERSVIGTRLNTVADLEVQHLRREDELTGRISDVEEVDMTQAIMDYRLAETAYEAALNVASQGFRLSLMDFIRG
ncbi:MAG: flagellar hook-associated protein FlgL [Fimbriimonas sp.]